MVKHLKVQKNSSELSKGVTLVELMITVAVIGIVIGVGPALLTNMVRFWKVQLARVQVQKNARVAIDLINRNLRQATASSVVISQRDNQPPYSWITFEINRGTGSLLGTYGAYQEGKNLNYVRKGDTTTIADNLKFLTFTYPKTDNDGIISVSMTFEEDTFAGQKKALQLSIEKVRVMN